MTAPMTKADAIRQEIRNERVNASYTDATTMFEAGERWALCKLRPEVLKFALLMEANLKKHDTDRGRKGWKDDSPTALFVRAEDEFRELTDALENYLNGRLKDDDANALAVAKEAADVANFCMMVADVVGGLK